MRLGHLDLTVLQAKRTGIKNKKTPLKGGIGNGDEDQSVPISPEGTPDDAVGFAKKMKEQG